MSTTIDNRVVSMQFDNKHFEQNVQTSLSTLDKLKQSLKLKGASDGLENVSSAAKGVNFSPLASSIDTVSLKFSAMYSMADQVFRNIATSAMTASKQIVSAFTIDPVKSGFSEYETQINAVQTILANTKSKGSTIDDVNGALDELNTYADKTIYNFTEMTRNIGTFTAAGVDLDKSVTSIKGIANLAAVSGSTSQQASSAMYQLSQALASGKVSLMDWNSVVNAGMGGEVFQEALKRTATNMGTDVDALIEKYGSFRESLTQGEWLTADVLTETLTQLSGAYTEADLIAKGYTTEQAKEIVELAKTAESAATDVKTFTQLIDTTKEALQSGWTQSWEIIIGDFEEAKALWSKVSEVLGGIIGSSAEARNNMLQGWADGGGRGMAIEGLTNIFEGLVSVIKPIKEAFREIFPPTTSEQLIKMTEAFRDFTAKLKLSDTQSAKLKSTFKGLFSIVKIAVDVVKAIASGAVFLISKLAGLGDIVLNITGTIGDWISKLQVALNKSNIFSSAMDKMCGFVQGAIDKIKEFASVLGEKFKMPGFEVFLIVIGGIWKAVQFVASKIGDAFSSISDAFMNVFRSGDIGTGLDILNGGIFAAILLGIKKFVGGLSDAFDNVGGVLDNVKGILDSVRGCFEAYQQNLQAKTLLTIASAIAILAAAILVISLIDADKLSASLGAVTVLFADLLGSLALFSRMSGNLQGVTKATFSMIAISVAVLILASALKKVASVDVDKMFTGLVGVAALSAIVVQTAKALSKDTGKVMKGAISLIGFSVAINVLASAVKSMSSLNWEELAKGLVGVGALMASVSIFLNNTTFNGKAFGTALGMVLLASAIKILASSCKDFGNMDWGQIGKGLATIGILLTELALFTNLTGNAQHVVSTGLSLVLIASSMKIFASAMQDFATMGWEEIGKGLTAMAVSLLAVTLAVNFMPKNMIGIGVGLLAISSALTILANAVSLMGSMSWDEVARGLATLGGSLLLLTIGLHAMSGTLAGSAALLVAAMAIGVLTPSLLLLGSMSWESIGKGLLTIAGAFTILGVAGAILAPIIPAILGLGAGMALVGVGCLAAGVGIMALSAGLTALAMSGTAVSAAITAIIVGLIQGVGAGIVALAGIIIQGAPAIMAAITVLITSLLTALVTCIPRIIDAGMKIILALLTGIKNNIGKIVKTGIDIILNFIKGVTSKIGAIIDTAFKVIIAFINGLANAIRENTDALISAVENLFDAVLEAAYKILTKSFGKFGEIGGKIIKWLKDGIKKGIGKIKDVAKDVIEGFQKGLTDKLKSIGSTAKKIGKKLLNGVKDALGIKSPSREFMKVGKYSDEGLIKGLMAYSGKVAKSASNVGNSALDAMRNSLAGISSLVESDIDSQPTIRPVLDLSEIESGAGTINGMFRMQPSVGVMSNIHSINSAMNGRPIVTNADVVSAISDLKGSFGSSGDTYQINGITYDDGSNISSAIKTLVGAARMERRV